jgi:hypothetical protein
MRIGKHIGSAVYVHRDYTDILPQTLFKEALSKLPKFKWDYVKFDKSTGWFTFCSVDDFDKTDEPIITRQVLVKKDSIKELTISKSNPQILHGKHLFVGKDYKGFDWDTLDKRFQSYQHLDKSRIGRLNYWKEKYL